MKEKLIGGAVLAALLGLTFGAKQGYREIKIKGCKEATIKSVAQRYGEAPDDAKDKFFAAVDAVCRQLL
jgi:hypothetical protein